MCVCGKHTDFEQSDSKQESTGKYSRRFFSLFVFFFLSSFKPVACYNFIALVEFLQLCSLERIPWMREEKKTYEMAHLKIFAHSIGGSINKWPKRQKIDYCVVLQVVFSWISKRFSQISMNQQITFFSLPHHSHSRSLYLWKCEKENENNKNRKVIETHRKLFATRKIQTNFCLRCHSCVFKIYGFALWPKTKF